MDKKDTGINIKIMTTILTMLSDVQEEIKFLLEEIDGLRQENNKLRSEIVSLEHKTKELEHVVQQKMETITDLKEKNFNLHAILFKQNHENQGKGLFASFRS